MRARTASRISKRAFGSPARSARPRPSRAGTTALPTSCATAGDSRGSLTPFEEALPAERGLGITPQRRMLAGMLRSDALSTRSLGRGTRGRERIPRGGARGSHYHAWHAPADTWTSPALRGGRVRDRGLRREHRGSPGPPSIRSSFELRGSGSTAARFCSSVGSTRPVTRSRSRSPSSKHSQGRSAIRPAVPRRHGIRARRGSRRVLGPRSDPTWAEAAEACFAGEFVQAADRYEAIGRLTDEAEARLRAARHLIESGRRDEGGSSSSRR